MQRESSSRSRIALSPLLYPQPEERLGELSLGEDEPVPFALTEEPSSIGERDSDVGSDDLETQDAADFDPDEGVSMPGVTHSSVHLFAR